MEQPEPQAIRSPCPATKCPPRNIPGMYYRATSDEPVRVLVSTTIPDVESDISKRFPSFESILGTKAPIHECLVTAYDAAGKAHKFLLGYQEHDDFPMNRALRNVLPEASFRGELVVMRSGTRSLVIGMKGKRDAQLAEEAVRRFLRELRARRARNRRLSRLRDVPARLS